MKFGMHCSIFLMLLLLLLQQSKVGSKENYLIYDVKTNSEYERGLWRLFSENEMFRSVPLDIDISERVSIETGDREYFENLLAYFKLGYSFVGESESRNEVDFTFLAENVSDSLISFQKYQRYDDINAYLDQLATLFPERVNVEVAGHSYEKRELKTITITNGDKKPNKHVILVDAGLHAREWIAPAAALYIIYELVEKFERNEDLLERYNWVIFPMVNPDGYEYTHTRNRMWRKTRKPNKLRCIGTDANRNFDFHWGEIGASGNCNADTYKGQTAFSEPETQALRKVMWQYKEQAKFYLTLHSYGRYILYPWGYTKKLPNNWQDLEEVAQAGAAAIKNSTGAKYKVGSSSNVLYPAAGGSDDYALGTVGIPISITMELAGGGSGFNPPTAKILPFVKETWTGIRAMAEKVNKKY